MLSYNEQSSLSFEWSASTTVFSPFVYNFAEEEVFQDYIYYWDQNYYTAILLVFS
jgi:hypothetical protein